MLPTEDLFVYVYVLIDDLVAARIIAIPRRPGPAPACSDAELLAIAQVRHLLGRRSEAGFLAEVARDWAHLFPHLPHQSEASRRIRWLWGAFEQLQQRLSARPDLLGGQDVEAVEQRAPRPVAPEARPRRLQVGAGESGVRGGAQHIPAVRSSDGGQVLGQHQVSEF